MSRREFLVGASATALITALPGLTAQAHTEPQPVRDFTLRPGKASAQLVPGNYPATPVWAYNQLVPGPEIRLTQGDRVRIDVENAQEEETTMHWHGLRVPGVSLAMITSMATSAVHASDALIYKNPQCGCCENYANYLRANDHEVSVKPKHELPALSREYGLSNAEAAIHCRNAIARTRHENHRKRCRTGNGSL